MTRWWLCAFAALALASVAGCKTFDSSLLPPSQVACPNGSKVPPSAPTASDANSLPEMVFALKDVTLDTKTAGFNLDGICTGSTGPWGCLPSSQLSVYEDGGVPSVPQDVAQGVDTQFGVVVYPYLQTVGAANFEGPTATSEGQGVGTPIVLLDNYSGTANDPKVTVAIATSVFAAEGTGGAGGTPPAVCPPTTPGGTAYYAASITQGNPDGCSPSSGVQVPPIDPNTSTAWQDGNLWLWARDDGFVGGMVSQPAIVDQNAYVNNYVFVAHLPAVSTFTFMAGSTPFQITLHDAVAVGTLKQDFTGSGPAGVTIAGRWATADILTALGAFNVCPGSPLYQNISGELSSVADVVTTAGNEATDATCTAVSVGFTLTAYRANLGGLAPGPTVPACP